MSTIALADRVVLLDGGRITDSGSHSSLLDRNTLYASIIAEAESAGYGGDALMGFGAPIGFGGANSVTSSRDTGLPHAGVPGHLQDEVKRVLQEELNINGQHKIPSFCSA